MRRSRLVLVIAAAFAACAATAPPSWRPPDEARLAGPHEPGERFVLEGFVVSRDDGRPLRGVHVHAYHADAHGRYAERADGPARLAGDLESGPQGTYTLRSIVPGLAEGSPHVHLEIFDATRNSRLLLTLNLCRTHGAGSDAAFERLPYFAVLPKSQPPGYWAKVERAADTGFVCRWNIPVPPAFGTPAK
jgi:hypothetical protein